MSNPVSFTAIICTHQPPADRLIRVLDALTRAEGIDEVLVVENAGLPIEPNIFDLFPGIRHIREERLGLIYARAAGIRSTKKRWLVFIDDDNLIASDYVRKARDFIERHNSVGVFGGRISGEFECEPKRWKRPALPFLGLRDLKRIAFDLNR